MSSTAYFRDLDSKARQVERKGTSKATATDALKLALRDRARTAKNDQRRHPHPRDRPGLALREATVPVPDAFIRSVQAHHRAPARPSSPA